MAPKKKGEAPVQKRIFGRFSNSLKMGIVGLPNVGKSSFFNALANLSVPAENYPFCTIEPSVRVLWCRLLVPRHFILAVGSFIYSVIGA